MCMVACAAGTHASIDVWSHACLLVCHADGQDLNTLAKLISIIDDLTPFLRGAVLRLLEYVVSEVQAIPFQAVCMMVRGTTMRDSAQQHMHGAKQQCMHRAQHNSI